MKENASGLTDSTDINEPAAYLHYSVSAGLPYDAVIFDMDGVVTDTARLHAKAWKQLFDVFLAQVSATTNRAQPSFDLQSDYRRWVDGRSREDGVAAFLEARGIPIPLGSESDTSDVDTVHGLAKRKNDLFHDLLDSEGLRVFSGTTELIQRLRRGGVRLGLVTASRNAARLLNAANLQSAFDAVVDGTTAVTRHLPGKPNPAMFLEAAHRLGAEPARCVVIEDAVAGVQAAAGGGFGMVVGIDRSGQRSDLAAAGADIVLDDVSELDLGALRSDPWRLIFEGFDSAHEGHREALTVLANGYVGIRGAAPEHRADESHYPGVYLAGIYNRLSSVVQGVTVEDEHMINAPNWTALDVRVEGQPWWSAGGLTVHNEHRDLDLRAGILNRTGSLHDGHGRTVRMRQRRLVSMTEPHVASLQTELVPQGWSGRITVCSSIDTAVANSNVPEYQHLSGRHLIPVATRTTPDGILVTQVQTISSRILIAMAMRTRIDSPASSTPCTDHSCTPESAQHFTIAVSDGVPVIIEKTVAIVTSRDPAIASPETGAVMALRRVADGFLGLLPRQEMAFAQLWDEFGIELLGASVQDQLVLNLHLFHLAQTITTNSAEVDAGVPARGLHGEGYRGHVFWDELFVLPLVTLLHPAVARSLLHYRFRRMPPARDAARDAGLKGAMFPWQSGSDGREETPDQLFNTRSNRWMPDNSHRQRHVGLAVAYNAWQYFECTGDLDWLAHFGGELIVEVARFFASLAVHDADADRYHLYGVMGPDEYHDGYPDAVGQGLRDNAYTNVMAAWVCGKAIQVFDLLDGPASTMLADRLSIDLATEPSRWGSISQRMFVPFHDEVISQFDGYADLHELDWDRYRTTYGNIGRLDLILESEGDSTNRYKLAKQADALMLLYLHGPDRLLQLLDQLGYVCTRETLHRTVSYYLARTAHGSTLSRVVHASVLAMMNDESGWQIFQEALLADLDDTQGGTTTHGIHLGAMAGTIDIVLRSFAGLHCHGGNVSFNPRLPRQLSGVKFHLRYRRHHLDIELSKDRLTISSRPSSSGAAISVSAGGQRVSLPCGQTITFPLDSR